MTIKLIKVILSPNKLLLVSSKIKKNTHGTKLTMKIDKVLARLQIEIYLLILIVPLTSGCTVFCITIRL